MKTSTVNPFCGEEVVNPNSFDLFVNTDDCGDGPIITSVETSIDEFVASDQIYDIDANAGHSKDTNSDYIEILSDSD